MDTFNLSIRETETGPFLSLRLACFTQWVSSKPGYIIRPCLKTKTKTLLSYIQHESESLMSPGTGLGGDERWVNHSLYVLCDYSLGERIKTIHFISQNVINNPRTEKNVVQIETLEEGDWDNQCLFALKHIYPIVLVLLSLFYCFEETPCHDNSYTRKHLIEACYSFRGLVHCHHGEEHSSRQEVLILEK